MGSAEGDGGMSRFTNEANALVARKVLLMTRFAGGMSAKEFNSYQDEIAEIDKRLSELRKLIEAE